MDYAEERFLIQKAQQGDKAATEKLLWEHREFIQQAVGSYGLFLKTQDRDDFTQAATIGFWNAILKYDLKAHNERLCAYAHFCMRGEMKKLVKTEIKSQKGKTAVLIDAQIGSKSPSSFFQKDFEQAVSKLTSREEKILRAKTAGISDQILASDLGVSRQRVQQLKKKANLKLRKLFADGD